jgi:hypothetical protein
MKTLENINEEDEFLLIDKSGNAYDLNKDQLSYLKSLSGCGSEANKDKIEHAKKERLEDIDEEQIPVDLDFEVLNNLNPVELNKILDDNKEEMMGVDPKHKSLLTHKKQYLKTNAHNSEDFKELGNLHKDQRAVEYFPGEDRHAFESKPQNFGVPP